MWQPVAAEETGLLDTRCDFELDLEPEEQEPARCVTCEEEHGVRETCCTPEGTQRSSEGNFCQAGAALSSVPSSSSPVRCKSSIKRASCLSDGLGKKSKKRVRWADLEERKERSLRCFDDTFRPCTLSTGVITALLTLLLMALMGSWSSQVSNPSKVLFYRPGQAENPRLRFDYPPGICRDSDGRPKKLALDGHNRVIFHQGGLLAADQRVFQVQQSSISVRKDGLYRIALSYEHSAANVTMALSLPLHDEQPQQPFVLQGHSDALHTHCTVSSSPQNITVAVHSPDGGGTPGDFKSLVLEVTRLGEAGLQPGFPPPGRHTAHKLSTSR